MRIYLLPLALLASSTALVYSTNTITGTAGHDQIDGTADADIIIGGPGHDTLNGFEGDDQFLMEGTDNDFDVINGGAGFDVIKGSDQDDLIGLYGLSATNSIEQIDGGNGVNHIVGTAYSHTWDFSQIDLLNIHLIDGQDGHDTIKGSQGNDVISGSAGYDTLEGNNGNDQFIFKGKNSGFDTVRGGDGFDMILGSDEDDDIGLFSLPSSAQVEKIDGGLGFNRILGDVYDHAWDFTQVELVNIDQIDGQAGHDSIIGSSGDDVIIGGAGFDSLQGGEGNDTFVVNGTENDFDTIKGGSGFDVIEGGAGDDDIGLYALTTTSSIERIDGGAGFNRILGYKYEHTWDFSTVELVNIQEINGQEGSDSITGSISNDTIVGAEGDDTLHGFDGDDTFLVSGDTHGYDAIRGGEGFDIILGSDNDDLIGLYALTALSSIERIDGGAGINTIVGPPLDLTWDFTSVELLSIQQIQGNRGHDRITGSNGDDVIVGGEGYDTLSGGNGNDRFLISGTNQGFDSIAGNDGYDVLEGTASDDDFGLYPLNPASGLEKIDGGLGYNRIIGLNYDHTWDFSSTELVNIASINGMGGHDTIIGSSANDTILGGDGYDTLNGGPGSDRYEFHYGDDQDRISDTGPTTEIDTLVFGDTFEFGLGLSKENIWFSFEGSNLRIDVIGSNDVVLIPNWSTSNPIIERIETKQDTLHFSEISALVSAMSDYTAPAGEGAELTAEMKTVLYPVISSAWNAGAGVDSDGDGIEDSLDAFPNDPSESVDSDGDGVGDNSDAFINNPEASVDSDNDGAPDTWHPNCDAACQSNSDLTLDAFPNDPNEWLDTDGDGTGNNSDDDIDNDGFSNDIEIEKGTDPFDPNSYPQASEAEITIHTDNNQTVSSKDFTIQGLVTKGDLDIAKLYLTDMDSSVSYILVLNGDGTFNAQVSLQSGLNRFQISVEDVDENTVSEVFQVTYVASLTISSIAPQVGAEVNDPQISLDIHVQAGALPTVRINGVAISLVAQTTNGYQFSTPFTLAPGLNQLILDVVEGAAQVKQTLEYFYRPSDMSLFPKPVLSVISPDNQTRTANAELPLQIAIQSNVGGIKAKLNGVNQNVQKTADHQYMIQSPILLNEGENVFVLNVEDALAQTESVSLGIERDTKAPSIVFDETYDLPPSVNTLPSTRFEITGRIEGDDLSTLTINGDQANVSFVEAGIYAFSHPLAIAANQDVLVSAVATDELGNETTKSIYFAATNNLSMEWVTPTFPVKWILESGTEKPFAIKLNDPSGSESYDIQITSSQGTQSVVHEKIDNLLTGTLPALTQASEYTLQVVAKEGGEPVSSLTGKLTLISQDDIEVAVSSVVPEREAVQLEPDTYMQVNFNRPVDPNRVEIIVRRTLHGKTYVNNDATGQDFLHAKGSQLVQVDVDRELVNGSISILPDDSSFVFYPSQDLGYTAEIDWQVKYDGQTLAKQRFKTRDLPTIIEGGIKDSLNQTLQGISVELEELGYTATTNSDGGYSFGYGLGADKNIPEGRYHLLINRDYKFAKIGQIRVPVDIVGGKRNQLSLIRVPNLSEQIQWISAPNGVSNINLAQGDLKLALNGADLNFPSVNRSIHAQFIPSNAMVRNIYPGAIPLWFYQLQPFGIQPTQPIDIEIKAPLLRGSLDYLGAFDGKPVYAFLLGYSKRKDVIEPVGVVEIIDGVMKTLQPVTLESLDYIGYGHVKYEYQEQFKQFKNNEISFVELVAQLTVD